MTNTTEQIARMLKQSAEWVSGEQLGARLEISRNAIFKHIRALRGDGYRIASSPRRGYRLESAPNMPYAAEVEPLLTGRYMGRPLLYFPQVDSTNRVAAGCAREGAVEGTTVVADSQTAGRGRLQRPWYSPAGTNLYFSIVLRPLAPPTLTCQLPILAATALLEALDLHWPELEAKVKWPNDIFVGGRKLCGVLCENESEVDVVHYVVVGIGIDVNTLAFPPELAGVATSLRAETGAEASRPALLADVLNAFEAAYERWKDVLDLGPFLPFLASRSLMMNRRIVVQGARGETRGRMTGLASDGGLLLETASGRVTIVSGDATIADRGP